MRFLPLTSLCLLFLSACSWSGNSQTALRSEWSVEAICAEDSTITVETTEHPTLSFDSDSTFSGQTLCNNFSGIYHTDGKARLTLSIDAITTAFCPDNTLEGLFIEQLSLSEYYAVMSDTLLLKDGDGRVTIKLTKI